jgi:DNA-binding CsgD family transcriptional regulator
MMASFEPGRCKNFIDSIEDEALKKLVLGEYNYFIGNPLKATEYAKPFLTSDNLMIRLYSWVIYTFGNVSLGKPGLTAVGVDEIQKTILAEGIDSSKENHLIWIFAVASAKILFKFPVNDSIHIKDYLKGLPEPVQMFGCYLMAHEAYMNEEYEKSLGIIHTSMALSSNVYPILFMYFNIIAAIDEISLKNIQKAQEYFIEAWKFAKADGFVEPIGEYHGLLKGLVETCVRHKYPDDYKKITEIAFHFGHGWMKARNLNNTEAADLLTSIEFTVANLANEDWSNQEIADYLGISVRTVKYYMTSIFNKFNISSRKQIREHLPQ